MQYNEITSNACAAIASSMLNKKLKNLDLRGNCLAKDRLLGISDVVIVDDDFLINESSKKKKILLPTSNRPSLGEAKKLFNCNYANCIFSTNDKRNFNRHKKNVHQFNRYSAQNATVF